MDRYIHEDNTRVGTLRKVDRRLFPSVRGGRFGRHRDNGCVPHSATVATQCADERLDRGVVGAKIRQWRARVPPDLLDDNNG